MQDRIVPAALAATAAGEDTGKMQPSFPLTSRRVALKALSPIPKHWQIGEDKAPQQKWLKPTQADDLGIPDRALPKGRSLRRETPDYTIIPHRPEHV